MKRLVILIICFALMISMISIACPVSAGENTDIVKTSLGEVRGVPSETYSDVVIFKGIPYAAPPVGDLRWKPPVDHEPWTGVRVCDTYGSAAPQYPNQGAGSEPYKTDFFYDPFPEVSEDCLYLNITTANLSSQSKKPVYVWYHGGGQRHGYSYEPEFAGDVLAKKGVVVVTVGHRLGVFGYMALPQLSQEQGGVSGNYGIMDLVKALEWIKLNIAEFGGDPENITLGGQSGGSTKAMVLAISPNSPKVQNLILQSGLKWFDSFRDIATAEESGQKYLSFLGLDPNAPIDELRNLDTKVLLATNMEEYVANAPSNIVKDGKYVVVSNVSEAVAQGALDGINIMSGTTLGEAASHQPLTSLEFYDKYKLALGELYQKYDFTSLVQVTDSDAGSTFRELATYGLNVGMGSTYSRSLMVNRVFGDYMSKISNKSGNMYSYVFTRFTPSKPEESGTSRDKDIQWAWHSSELWYSFGSLLLGIPPARAWQQEDVELADIMSSYWANFIKTGDPNSTDLPNWPKADSSYAYLELGDDIISHTNWSKLDDLIKEVVLNYFEIQLH